MDVAPFLKSLPPYQMLALTIGMSSRDFKEKQAAMRALEHQVRRANLVAPSRSTRRSLPSLQVLEAEQPPSVHNMEFDLMASMPSGEYDGAGKHTLMDHLKHPMKGFGDYMLAFKGGIRTGRYEGEGATPSMGLSQFRGGCDMARVVGAGKSTKPKLMLCDDPPESYSDSMGHFRAAGKMNGGVERIQLCRPPPAAMSDAHGTYARRQKRGPAKPSEKRSKRMEIVKRVMKERGLSLIEASKAVKADGLYKA